MSDLEIIRKRLLQQDDFIDLLRLKVAALENLLKNHISNFEHQYATELASIEVENLKRKAERDSSSD